VVVPVAVSCLVVPVFKEAARQLQLLGFKVKADRRGPQA